MDSFLLTVRVILSLAAVLVLLWWLQRRFAGTTGPGRAKAVTIIGRQGIGQRASIVVVDTGGRRLTLGVTEQNVTVLTDGPAPEPAPETETAPGIRPDQKTWNDTVAGSILAPDTWRRAGKALRGAPRP